MQGKNFQSLRFLPVLCFVWLVGTFIISYSIATALDHVHPVWPYISDTGTIPPESCIFGLLLNIGSLLMGLVLYIRYQQIRLILQTHETHNKLLNVMNLFCLVTGILAAFGACLVANFQETSNMAVHLFGANLCFGVGSGYFTLHTVMCFLINKRAVKMNVLRSVLCIIYVAAFVLTLIYAKKSFKERDVTFQEALQWSSDKPGYNFRLTSTFSEWILGVCLGLYILSLSSEFGTINYSLSFALNRPEEETSHPA